MSRVSINIVRVASSEFAACATTTTLRVVACVGVPTIMPLVVSVKPSGRLWPALDTHQLNAPSPPLACNVWAYASPTLPGWSAEVTMRAVEGAAPPASPPPPPAACGEKKGREEKGNVCAWDRSRRRVTANSGSPLSTSGGRTLESLSLAP